MVWSGVAWGYTSGTAIWPRRHMNGAWASRKERDRMRKERKASRERGLVRWLAAIVLGIIIVLPATAQAATSQDMYRLYNPYTGEHFYTSSVVERDSLVPAGWTWEGVGWVAPTSGEPVYRLYNPFVPGGDHHYTTSKFECDSLVAAGWSYEGVGWRSGGSVPIYRQYNPFAVTGTHNYTTSADENNHLVTIGWREEGVGWYGTGTGWTFPPQEPGEPEQPGGSQQPGDTQASVVYWTPGGEVWHSTRNCPSLKRSTTIYSGSITDAQSAGKSRPCKNCY